MFICLLYNSEVVLESQFTTNAEIIGVVCGQEGNLTIDANGSRNGDAQTCFTRELSFGDNSIHSHDRRASLDVVGSGANFTFVANVDICRGGGVVISSPGSICLYVNVGSG